MMAEQCFTQSLTTEGNNHYRVLLTEFFIASRVEFMFFFFALFLWDKYR